MTTPRIPYHIEIYQIPISRRSKGTQTWRWRLRAPNGKVIAQGERYSSPSKIRAVLNKFLAAVRGPAFAVKFVTGVWEP